MYSPIVKTLNKENITKIFYLIKNAYKKTGQNSYFVPFFREGWSMNLNVYIGRPTDNPTIRTYKGQNGKERFSTNFTIAVNRIYVPEGEKEADFIPCVAFGRIAEVIKNYVTKGQLICIKGELRNNDFQKGDKKYYGFQVVIDQLELIGKKKDKEEEDFHDANEKVPFREEGE